MQLIRKDTPERKISKKIEAAFLVYGNTTKPVGEIINDLTSSIMNTIEDKKGVQDWQIEISNLRRENEALKEQNKLLYDYLHEVSKQIQVKLTFIGK